MPIPASHSAVTYNSIITTRRAKSFQQPMPGNARYFPPLRLLELHLGWWIVPLHLRRKSSTTTIKLRNFGLAAIIAYVSRSVVPAGLRALLCRVISNSLPVLQPQLNLSNGGSKAVRTSANHNEGKFRVVIVITAVNLEVF